MSEEVIDLKFVEPAGGNKGHLRRQRDSVHVQLAHRRAMKALNAAIANEDDDDKVIFALEEYEKAFEAMIIYLLQFIEEPKDRDKAKEGLLDLSEDDYTNLLVISRGERLGEEEEGKETENPT